MRKMRERPIQIYLRPDQDAALRLMAKQEKVAIAELVRRGVDQLLVQVPVEQDPLMGIIGLGSSDVHDLAERHDYYIVQAIMAESQPPKKQKATSRKKVKYPTRRTRKKTRTKVQ